MSYKMGDIILFKFPFINFSKAKKRPVLVVKSENNLSNFICFQITSKSTSLNLLKIDSQNIQHGVLTLSSYLKYDKCFTLNSEIVDKKLTEVNIEFITRVKELFFDETFI